MGFAGLVEGPLLAATFYVFGIGIALRCGLFLYKIATKGASAFPAPFVPLVKIFWHKPFYTISRYLFHICLIVVPVYFSGHIFLWEESRFEWYWVPISDSWADGMTLIVIGGCVLFFLRRIVLPHVRHRSRLVDFLLIIATVLPFASGYLLSKGTLGHITFFWNYLETIHIFTSEILLFIVVFLCLKSSLDEKHCIGCCACQISCPTGAIECEEKETERTLSYHSVRCVYCAQCVQTCPDGAAELVHDIRPGLFFRALRKQILTDAKLSNCRMCGIPFAPEKQLNKIGDVITDNYLYLCPRCKGISAFETSNASGSRIIE